MADRPVTKRKRLFRLASMTARVAGDYAKTRVKGLFVSPENAQADREATHERNGRRIAQTLGELKGAVMKVGQMASVARDVLPKELAQALGALQNEAPPMPYDVISEQIESEFGSPPESLFRTFDRVPFAAASIGQVHRAQTDDGRDVVVKVQYPGVDDAVDSDLSHLKIALRASGLVRVSRRALDEIFREVKARLHEELDYCNEAENVRLFHNYYADDPRVLVPDVVGERSSQRVLTLTFVPGSHLNEVASFPQTVRDQLGEALFRVFLDQLFNLRVIHADPNPANFAFRPDGTIVMYDFGCIKKLDDSVVEAYRSTVRCGIVEDYAGLDQGLKVLGARNPQGPDVELHYYKRWRDIFAAPFLSEDPFDFGTASLHRQAMAHIPMFLAKYASAFQPAAELVFLDRVVVGHYGTLRRLGTRANFRPLLEPYLGLA